ncbi:MAG: class I mannose-6-phosphate isomerase [Elusimicrobiota bacterium]|jgi:mannose-6-phosphate isomerase class I|nr:class I mannose-6-phosphate isomerase [Elusimicrobiota bacterium]
MHILKPIVHETIWGGEKLTPFSGSGCTKIGHLYSAIDTEEFRNEIISGAYKGKNLHQWFLENRDKYGLGNYDELPILTALVEADEDLSIQVHPDDEMSAKLEGRPFGKNESFYILQAPASGKMYNGCKAASTDEMRGKISEGKIGETLDAMEIESGDYIYIEGGTLHAMTAGSLSFEIEENFGKTYRFWDYERKDKNGNKRPLQLESALACLDVKKRSVLKKYGEGPIEERMYSTRLVRNKNIFTNSGDMFSFAVMLEGGKIYDGVRVLPGTAVLLDAGETIDVSGAEWIIATPKAGALK